MTDKTPIENKIPTKSKQGQKAFKIYIGVADLHLKIGKIPVYSASPWIESLAHTVYDEYHNIMSIYYTNDPEFTNIQYNLYSSRLAFYKDQHSGNKISNEPPSS